MSLYFGGYHLVSLAFAAASVWSIGYNPVSELYCRVSMKDDDSTEGDYSAWSTKTNRLSRFLACAMPLARYFKSLNSWGIRLPLRYTLRDNGT